MQTTKHWHKQSHNSPLNNNTHLLTYTFIHLWLPEQAHTHCVFIHSPEQKQQRQTLQTHARYHSACDRIYQPQLCVVRSVYDVMLRQCTFVYDTVVKQIGTGAGLLKTPNYIEWRTELNNASTYGIVCRNGIVFATMHWPSASYAIKMFYTSRWTCLADYASIWSFVNLCEHKFEHCCKLDKTQPPFLNRVSNNVSEYIIPTLGRPPSRERTSTLNHLLAPHTKPKK